jgi:hypothetical protein
MFSTTIKSSSDINKHPSYIIKSKYSSIIVKTIFTSKNVDKNGIWNAMEKEMSVCAFVMHTEIWWGTHLEIKTDKNFKTDFPKEMDSDDKDGVPRFRITV